MSSDSDDKPRDLQQAGREYVKEKLRDRGWNVGSTMVEGGDGHYTFMDADSEVHNVQIVTAHPTMRDYGYDAEFRIDKDRVRTPIHPPLQFVLTVADDPEGDPHLAISQPDLFDRTVNDDLGTESEDAYLYHLEFHIGDDGLDTIRCADADLTSYQDELPPIDL